MNTTRTVPIGLLALLLSACAGRATLPQPEAPAHPGFDTWRFPGEAALRTWRTASPYRWVGYYLPAPCHRDTSWAGKRRLLEEQGWGTAVLYVGQQTFEDQPLVEEQQPDTILCSRTLLTPERGRTDARDAIARAAEDGFPAGTTIFLDVEPMQRIPPSFVAYYRAWTQEVLRDGTYRPGTYAHRRNAAALLTLSQAVYLAEGAGGTPPFWVAGGEGFTLERPPAASGLPFADVWQGALDVERSFGGVTLQVDENVATRASPSAP